MLLEIKFNAYLQQSFNNPFPPVYMISTPPSAKRQARTQEVLAQSTKVLHALTHPLRLKMLAYIGANEPVNVNSIYLSLELEQSVVSQHLRLLRQAQLVETQRKGKYIFYTLNYQKMGEAVRVAQGIARL